MLVPRALAVGCVTLTAACTASELRWSDPDHEDPDPSGPRYLRIYKESHYRDLGRTLTDTLSLRELVDRCRQARVLFLGDHHGDPALHHRFLQVVANLHDAGLRLRFGVECLGTEDQANLTSFLDGTLTLDALIERTCNRWPQAWFRRDGIDGAFYRELLQRARQQHFGMFPLEPAPRLALYERDQRMAQRIRREAEQHPGHLLVVVVGEAHLRGLGQLVARVDLPALTVAHRMSNSLRAQAAALRAGNDDELVESDAGVLFFLAEST